MYPFSDHLLSTYFVLSMRVKRWIKTNACISCVHKTSEVILSFCFISLSKQGVCPPKYKHIILHSSSEDSRTLWKFYTPWVYGLQIKTPD